LVIVIRVIKFEEYEGNPHNGIVGHVVEEVCGEGQLEAGVDQVAVGNHKLEKRRFRDDLSKRIPSMKEIGSTKVLM